MGTWGSVWDSHLHGENLRFLSVVDLGFSPGWGFGVLFWTPGWGLLGDFNLGRVLFGILTTAGVDLLFLSAGGSNLRFLSADTPPPLAMLRCYKIPRIPPLPP